MNISELHDQLNPTQCRETLRGASAMISELGLPEYHLLAPGCYRTAPARTDDDFDDDGNDRVW